MINIHVGQLRVWHSVYFRRDPFRVESSDGDKYVVIRYIAAPSKRHGQSFEVLSKYSSLFIDFEEELLDL